MFEPIIRKAAGLGNAPKEKDCDTYEYFYAHVDLLIIGGGIAGLAAASSAVKSGLKVLVAEQNDYWGGRAIVDDINIENVSGSDWIARQVRELV